jgi:arylamine N-acetyltransferase
MPDHFDRYLGLLGVRRTEPGIQALEEIVRAHMVRVPFENISKLYHARTSGVRGIPDLAQYLDGIERFHFGGTCYANNF